MRKLRSGIFTPVCSRGTAAPERLAHVAIAAGKMYMFIWWGLGGWMLSLVGFVVFGVAIWMSSNNEKMHDRNSNKNGNENEEEDLLLDDALFCATNDEYRLLQNNNMNYCEEIEGLETSSSLRDPQSPPPSHSRMEKGRVSIISPLVWHEFSASVHFFGIVPLLLFIVLEKRRTSGVVGKVGV
jgi:hypothetical protein